MSEMILESIATAFEQLKDDVHIALHTQIGDSSQLDQRITACSRLLLHINQVSWMKCCSVSSHFEISA